MPKSPAGMLEAIRRNMPDRTGRTVEEWAELVRKDGPKGTKERIAWLRARHRLGGPTAMVAVAEAEGTNPLAEYEEGDALVEAMFRGPKAALRPAFEAALAAARTLGKDVTPSARKTYLTLSRKRQFAVLQPSTSTRLDVGLVLPGVKPQGRLRASANVGGGRVTHAIAVLSAKDVDAFVRRWLKTAYDQDA
jgi:hypothetical protein